MSTKTANCYLSGMARRIEAGIISSGNPFVEEYLDSMDCSVKVELAQLRGLQEQVERHPAADITIAAEVLNKYLFGWKEADKFLACIGLKPSAKWAEGWLAAQRA